MSEPRPPAEGFPTVGVVGGGQLARMLAPAAVPLGVGLRVLAASPDDCATQVGGHDLGRPDDPQALAALAGVCDVVTFDHEHVPGPLLDDLTAAGHAVRPGPRALAHAQDKLHMRRALVDLGLPVPAWAAVPDEAALDAFGREHGWPVVLKTPRGGYDGKGVLVVESARDARTGEAPSWFARSTTAGRPLLAEEHVPFTRELAVLAARSPSGQVALWPVAQTRQVDGVCREVVAPAPGLDDEVAGLAARTAATIAGALDVTGVLAVEGFEVRPAGGPARFVVNELAMRPHNSGHWTIDGSVTSQFEQHLRAVLDLPLGAVGALAPHAVMVNVLGGDRGGLYRTYLHVMARDPAVKVHLYGKQVRPGRKIGHVTVVGDDLDDLLERARHAADYIAGVIDE